MMAPRQPETFPPVTPGPIRSHGCRDLLVYCESGWCHRSAVMNADWLPDEIPLRSRMAELFGRQRGCRPSCGGGGAAIPAWEAALVSRPAPDRKHALLGRLNHHYVRV